MLQKYFDYVLINSTNWSLSLGQLIILLALIIVLSWAFYQAKIKLLPFLYKRYEFLKKDSSLINKTLISLFIVTTISIALYFSEYQLVFIDNEHIIISISSILNIITTLLLARLAKWVLVDILHNHYYNKTRILKTQKDIDERTEKVIENLIKSIIYVVAILWSLHLAHLNISYSFSFIEKDGSPIIRVLSLTRILGAILIILGMRLLVWLINELLLRHVYEKKSIDYSQQFALNQLTKYFIYVITFVIILDYIGLNLTIIWGSAAALLVGIGLGLQDTFKDFVSGIVLLFERSIGVGDILEINDEVGIVTEIGIRASLVETNNNITVVVPNSQLVNITVNNWTSINQNVRLEISVGVAYGTDSLLVQRVLIEAAMEEPMCLKTPKPAVFFDDFGSSSLDFKLLFFIDELLLHRQIKSRIRFNINRLFIENKITIPFPQQDVHFRS